MRLLKRRLTLSRAVDHYFIGDVGFLVGLLAAASLAAAIIFRFSPLVNSLAPPGSYLHWKYAGSHAASIVFSLVAVTLGVAARSQGDRHLAKYGILAGLAVLVLNVVFYLVP